MTFSEIIGDIFTSPVNNTIIHCVSADKALGKGIALSIKNEYPNMIPSFNNTTFEIGKAYGFTNHTDKRSIINLVTKNRYYEKPTYSSLEQSLYSAKELIISHNIKRIAMPRIGCGLDRLDWDRVAYLISGIFNDLDIEITIYIISK